MPVGDARQAAQLDCKLLAPPGIRVPRLRYRGAEMGHFLTNRRRLAKGPFFDLHTACSLIVMVSRLEQLRHAVEGSVCYVGC